MRSSAMVSAFRLMAAGSKRVAICCSGSAQSRSRSRTGAYPRRSWSSSHSARMRSSRCWSARHRSRSRRRWTPPCVPTRTSISRSISRTSAGWTRPAATRWTPSLGPTRLDPKRSYKPLDVGNGIVSGTVTPNGRWLSLGITHPVHGRVVLSDADAFPDDQRLEQGAVRAYRASLASPSRKGFGLALLASGEAEAFLVEDSLPLAVLDHPGYARFETLTLAPRGRTGALQIVRVAAHEQNIGVGIEWHGRMRLGRAAYTQLTPGGALPAARSNTTTGEDGQLI